MRGHSAGWVLVLAVALVIAGRTGSARADKLVIDRVETRASILPGQTRVRALVTATQTGGGVVEAPREGKDVAMKVQVAAQAPPFLLGAFEHAEVELSLVIALPTTLDFEADFEPMKEAIDTELLEPLAALGARVRIQVMGYGSDLAISKGFLRPAEARKAFADLYNEGAVDPMDLAEVVGRAVRAAGAYHKKPRNKDALTRAAVVLVGSGVAVVDDDIKRAISDVGKDAAKAGVRIHTIGFSPSPDGKYRPVRPLLALGELSRQSLGTFRWVKTEEGWRAALSQLRQELLRQQVITFFGPAEDLDKKRLHVTVPLGTKALSGEVVLPSPRCGRETCDEGSYCVATVCVARTIERSGGFGRVLLYGGAGVGGLVVVLGLVSLVLRRRERVVAPPPGFPAVPGAPAGVPGLPPGGPGAPAGYPVPGAPPGVPGVTGAIAAQPAPVPGGPVLIVLTGPAAGTRLPLRHGFTVGKAPGNDLDLAHDGYASGHHAQIAFDGASWMVYDQGSTNGTFANGVRITQTRLDPGMTIRFGSTEVRFWVG